MKTVKDRFWAKVDKSGECWLWTAGLNQDGYGSFSINRSYISAHRASYLIEHKVLPDGKVIDHLCHVRRCVRPTHLRAVTHKQNHENRKGAQSNSKSGVRGVSWHKKAHKWVAQVKHHGKVHYVGAFMTVPEAEEAVSRKRRELFSHSPADHVVR